MKNRVNTFILGVQKSATTSLHDWMVQHSDIYGPVAMKDYHFFSNDKYYNNGYNFFHDFFPNHSDEKIIINGAVNYIYFSDKAAKRIHEYNPDSKFILVLRNPVRRAFSAYTYFKKNQEESATTFEQAIEKEKNIDSDVHEVLGRFKYLDHGFYAKQLKPFMDLFDRSQFHFTTFESLLTNKDEEVKKIFDFLDIDSDFVPTYNRLNITGQAKSKTLQKLLYTEHPAKAFAKKILPIDKISLETKTKIAFYLRKLNTSSNTTGEKEVLSDDLYNQLIVEFKDDIKELETMTGLELEKLWI